MSASVVWLTELSLGWAIRPPFMGAQLIRSELALFPSVIDVLPGPSEDVVTVVHTGPARPEAWRAELCEAGILPQGWTTGTAHDW